MRSLARSAVVTLLGLSLAGLIALGPGPADACDAPVHALARGANWARGPYTLLVLYQPGLADPKAFVKTAEGAALLPREEDSPIATLNLTSWTLDVTGPVQWDYQDILNDCRVKAYPMLALLDGAGKVIAEFQSLPEARLRLAPAVPGEVVSYTMRKIVLKDKPARIVILHDSKALIDLDSPVAATRPDDLNRVVIADPENVKRVPAMQIAERWVKEIAAAPLAGLGQADAIDVREPGKKNATVVAAIGLHPLPMCVLVDPLRRTIATFDKLPDKAMLRRIAYSPARDQIIKRLNAKGGTMCLLTIHGSDAKANKQADQAVAKGIELSKQNVPVLAVDGNSENEEFLVRTFDFRPGQAQPVVVAIFGQGKALDPITPGKDKTIDPADVLEAVNFVFNPGCAEQAVGFDLLMGASDDLPAADRKWAPSTQPVRRTDPEEEP